MGARKATARFYFHGSNESKVETSSRWFDVGEMVPPEVVAKVGGHLFEEEADEVEPEVEDQPQTKRRGRVPRQRESTENE